MSRTEYVKDRIITSFITALIAVVKRKRKRNEFPTALTYCTIGLFDFITITVTMHNT